MTREGSFNKPLKRDGSFNKPKEANIGVIKRDPSFNKPKTETIAPEQEKYFENWYYVSPSVISLEVECATSARSV